MGAAVAASVATTAVAVYLAVAAEVTEFPGVGGPAPAGLFASGFGFVVLGFALLTALGASAWPRLGASVRGGAARLGVGVGCVASAAVGLWALGVGVLTPVLMRPGAFATLWALGLAVAGAVLLGASVTGLCRVVRRRGARPQTHYNG